MRGGGTQRLPASTRAAAVPAAAAAAGEPARRCARASRRGQTLLSSGRGCRAGIRAAAFPPSGCARAPRMPPRSPAPPLLCGRPTQPGAHLRVQGLALWVIHRAVHAARRHRHLHRRPPVGGGAGGAPHQLSIRGSIGTPPPLRVRLLLLLLLQNVGLLSDQVADKGQPGSGEGQPGGTLTTPGCPLGMHGRARCSRLQQQRGEVVVRQQAFTTSWHGQHMQDMARALIVRRAAWPGRCLPGYLTDGSCTRASSASQSTPLSASISACRGGQRGWPASFRPVSEQSCEQSVLPVAARPRG